MNYSKFMFLKFVLELGDLCFVILVSCASGELFRFTIARACVVFIINVFFFFFSFFLNVAM
jgi:hypothetical protein